VSFEDAGSAAGLRKASDREGTLRIVTIRDLDRSACGGTHVRATGEIGPILLRRQERVGIVVLDAPVAAAAEEASSAIEHRGTDGHSAFSKAEASFLEGGSQERFVVQTHRFVRGVNACLAAVTW
ncbi:MAG TPA: hypothetical protein VFY90_14825, partial [Tepidiformaceae bacterium]|nr:hypothetical protein [Tepidiformaceae bacterium]